MGKFVCLNGWSPDRDLSDMLAHAGTRSSAGDLDARPDDPRFFPSASKGKDYQAALQEVRAAAIALYGRERTVDELFGDEKLAAETALVAGTLLAVARQTTNKDVVVVFGRDFYLALPGLSRAMFVAASHTTSVPASQSSGEVAR